MNSAVYDLRQALDIAAHGVANDYLYESSFRSHLRGSVVDNKVDFTTQDTRDVEWGFNEVIEGLGKIFLEEAWDSIQIILPDNDTYSLRDALDALKVYEDNLGSKWYNSGWEWQLHWGKETFNWHRSMLPPHRTHH